MTLRLKRAYDPPEADDGFRVLVDRIWPRGVKKDDLILDAWFKNVAPGAELRKWFGHDPARWEEFKSRYFHELDRNPEGLRELIEKALSGRITLIFSARDEEHNNAVALKEYLEARK